MMYRDDFDRLARELEPFWSKADPATELCERNVQSLSAMTREEIEDFLFSTARGSASVRVSHAIELDAVAA
jgi:hypothetical protein